MAAVSSIMEGLQELVGDQLQVVTYKWLARHHGIPYDTAKRVLFEFFTQHSQKVKATFLLSGWTKGEQQHVVWVVDGAKLEAMKSALHNITAMHVYSVQPGVPKDTADLYNADYAQSEALFRSLLSNAQNAENNPLASNTLSAVRCVGAKRDPALSAQRPAPKAAARTAQPDGSKAAAKAAPAKPAAAPAAASAPQKTAPAAASGAAASGAAEKEIAPAKAAKEQSGASGKSKTSPAGKKGNSLQQMWGKVPAKEKKAAPAADSKLAAATEKKGSKTAQPAKKAAAAARDGSEDEAPAQQARASGKARPRQQVLDESDSEEEEQDVAPAKKAKASLMQDSDFEDDFQPSKQPQQRLKEASVEAAEGGKGQPAKKKGKAPAKPSGAQKKRKDAEAAPADSQGAAGAAEEAPVESMQVEEEHAEPSPSQQQGPKYGSVKVRPAEPEAKRRRRVLRTYYNDAGEEVSEMVEEEESEGEDEAAAAPAEQQQQQKQQPKPAAGAAKAGGVAKSGGAVKSGGGGGKKKAAPAGQKSIASFFSKK